MNATGTFLDWVQKAAPEPGVHSTQIEGLLAIRIVEPFARRPVMYRMCLCLAAQGRKVCHLDDHSLVYSPNHYLLSTLALPVESEIPEASEERPYLGIVLEVDPAEVGRLLIDLETAVESEPDSAVDRSAGPGLVSCAMDESMQSTASRLLEASLDERDARILGPGLVRELLYRVLTGPHAGVLKDAVSRHSSLARIARVIRFLGANYRDSTDVDAMAQRAGMSTSALHLHFKRATTMSPIQYVKKLRLHQARELLLSGRGASEAAFEVGYASASQFSREFRRLFGVAPSSYRAAAVA